MPPGSRQAVVDGFVVDVSELQARGVVRRRRTRWQRTFKRGGRRITKEWTNRRVVELLRVIVRLTREAGGAAPSRRELATFLGCSPSTVASWVWIANDAGFLVQRTNAARGVRLSPRGERLLANAASLQEAIDFDGRFPGPWGEP